MFTRHAINPAGNILERTQELSGEDISVAMLEQIMIGDSPTGAASQNLPLLFSELCDKMDVRAALDLTERALKSVEKMVKGAKK